MKEVQIHDKIFRVSVPEEEIDARVRTLAARISEDYRDKDPVVVSVLNGAFMFTADLLRAFDFDPEVDFVRVSSYEGGMQSSGKMRSLFGLTMDITDRHVLIVEDIVDTGQTLDWLRAELEVLGPASVAMATLLFKREAFRGTEPPRYVGFEIPDKFVIGYGLDYDRRARSLRDIYVLKA